MIQKHQGIYEVAIQARIGNVNASDSYKEVLRVKSEQLREELGYSAANPLEKLAIEQIVLCWLYCYEIEVQHATYLSKSHNKDSGIYWEKRLAYASRRYERALEMLSRMRKMNLVVQVNNANNQIINNGH
ncbi:hypothetical protein [Adhaeribacter radiodurans]|uniref:Uncharacterized protein n=1 Tax=Adhaeribacter radiodurans TaxID=2745197 RepID=A0A7L7LG37_9BACT|nr:hypothetical protein [Adhaeribacter radiodurans]QMU31369.1 hypothetical protein HUW48_26550 [Adhaeribacter radiodurans]